MAVTRRAVFLDKDGTLVRNVPFNADPTKIELENGAKEALKMLAGIGFELHVVSNQSGVGLGLFPESALRDVEARLRELMREAGATLSGFYYCPHSPQMRCICRKPSPGMLKRAARERQLDLGASWMVGDILDDVEAGHRAGCRSILVDNGNETEWELGGIRQPDYHVRDLPSAIRAIAESVGST